LLSSFLSSHQCSLKICGVTTAEDARELVRCGVAALGVNFWPLSKRYISPDDAAPWLREVSGAILRVGVFVNASIDFIAELHAQGCIDAAQLHGDESPDEMRQLSARGVPCIKAIGICDEDDLGKLVGYVAAKALLLDTAAPGVYGGTGATFDWSMAIEAMLRHPRMPILLAGGITPRNAAEAIAKVHPAAIDIASGGESAPGVKDFDKVRALQKIVRGGH
jgi:phosphoribosylanthranilate isomerase